MIYNFTINDFEGPLDLLLHLIKVNKMDIENIKIESITNQYMNFINKMKEESIDIASSYLVMASELIHLKSKILLNKDDELKNKLIEYQNIKDITGAFKELEANRNEVYTKLPANLNEYKKDIPLDSNITLDDLVEAFMNFLEREKLKKPLK